MIRHSLLFDEFPSQRSHLAQGGDLMDGSRLVILVVDDEELVRDMVAAMIQVDRYHVLIASDGVQALDLSRRNGHIHLLISDISDVQMPGMNGVDLATRLLEQRPDIKVLLISGRPEVDIPPAFHCLAKPFTAAVL